MGQLEGLREKSREGNKLEELRRVKYRKEGGKNRGGRMRLKKVEWKREKMAHSKE